MQIDLHTNTGQMSSLERYKGVHVTRRGYTSSYQYILGDLALFDPGLDPLDPGLEPFLDVDGDLDPDLEPFLELGGVGLRLLVPFLEAAGEGERSFLIFLDFGEPCNMKDGNIG